MSEAYEVTAKCNQCGLVWFRGPGPYEPKDGEVVACPRCYPPPSPLVQAGHAAECAGLLGALDTHPPSYYVVAGTCTCGRGAQVSVES